MSDEKFLNKQRALTIVPALNGGYYVREQQDDYEQISRVSYAGTLPECLEYVQRELE